ncbi:hypothetical protein PENTCL1PPCAC_10597, partial [Pristionchus entomophagus]
RMDQEPSLSKKKHKKPTAEYSITTFELEKPRGNKFSSFDWAKVRKKLGDCESDEEDERFHDKDAVAIAKRLEAKYGNKKTKSGRKIRFNEEDFIEKSLGYDCEDDWIDDSEAYDELVPSTLDTKRGGFYVNRGPLEFVSIDDEFSDVESDDDEGRPKKSKKKEEKEKQRAPKRPDWKADEAKKKEEDKPKKRAVVISSSSSEEEREETRRVGGPPTLKKSKLSAPAAATAVAPVVKRSEEKRKEERAAEPRRMAGAPPSMLKKKSEPAVRPSLAGKPPSTAAVAAAARDVPVETVSSEDEVEVIEQPSSTQESAALPKDLNMDDVPNPVQIKIVQFHQLCVQQIKPGKKQVPQVVVDKAIEIQELTGRLGMKKSVRGLVLDRLAQLCGYSKPGLLTRINAQMNSRTTASGSALASTAATAAPATAATFTSQPAQRLAGGGGGAATGGGGVQPSTSTTSSMALSGESISSSTEDEEGAGGGGGPPILTPAVPARASVIGVKPPGVATAAVSSAAAAAAAAQTKEMVGKWTKDQVLSVLRQYPKLADGIAQLTTKYTFPGFCAQLAQSGLNVSAAPAAPAASATPAANGASSVPPSPAKSSVSTLSTTSSTAGPSTSSAPPPAAARLLSVVRPAASSAAAAAVPSPVRAVSATAAPAAAAAGGGISSSRLETAKKQYRSVGGKLTKDFESQLNMLLAHDHVKLMMENFKRTVVAKAKQEGVVGDRAMLFMDFNVHDTNIISGFEIFCQYGQKPFASSPIHYLAYLDDIMKRFYGSDARTDRLVRHFATTIPEMEAIRKLPEFTQISAQFSQKETALKRGGGAASSSPAPKLTPKQPQLTPSTSQQLQLQQTQQEKAALQLQQQLKNLTPQALQELLGSSQGASAQQLQQLALLQQILQQQQQQQNEAAAKKAKEEEDRRRAIATMKAVEAEKKRREK